MTNSSSNPSVTDNRDTELLIATVKDLSATLRAIIKNPDVTVRKACQLSENLVGTALYNADSVLESISK